MSSHVPSHGGTFAEKLADHLTQSGLEPQVVAFVKANVEAMLPAHDAEIWDQGARTATADYGIGEATNPYRTQ